MNNDPWLEKWLPLICEKSTGGVVLELGCGNGRDTKDLLSAGCRVIASDLSTENLRECAASVSQAQLLQLNNGTSLPFANASMAVIVASLSLHYFSWDVTMEISYELRRCLKAGGTLIARFNSTNDVNYGAGFGEEIEPKFYKLGTMTKRFFDEKSMRLFLQDWDIQFLEENTIDRYDKPKHVWEMMAISR